MKHVVSVLAASCVVLLVLASGCADVTATQKVGDFGTAFGTSSDEQKAIDWFKTTYGDPLTNNDQPARFLEPLITTGLSTNNMPVDKVTTFPVSGGSVYFFVIYDNFRKGDPITVSWVYMENGREVTKVEKQAGGDFGRFIVEFQKPDSGWGKGNQKITVTGNGASASVNFAIGDALQTTALPYTGTPGAEVTRGVPVAALTTMSRSVNVPAPVTSAAATQQTVTVDLNTDINNCGAIGNACPAYDLAKQHAQSRCVAGKCTMNCLTRYSDCNGNSADGCETNVEENANHCSQCGNACKSDEYCNNGACTFSCPSGATVCGSSASSSNELMGSANLGGGSGGGAARKCTVLSIDTDNCGKCGNSCFQPPNTLPVQCVDGTCMPSESAAATMKCQTGFLNCNGAWTDGCEINANKDSKNCGGCGSNCPMGFHCVGDGRCCDDPTGKLCCKQGTECTAGFMFALAGGPAVL